MLFRLPRGGIAPFKLRLARFPVLWDFLAPAFLAGLEGTPARRWRPLSASADAWIRARPSESVRTRARETGEGHSACGSLMGLGFMALALALALARVLARVLVLVLALPLARALALAPARAPG